MSFTKFINVKLTDPTAKPKINDVFKSLPEKIDLLVPQFNTSPLQISIVECQDFCFSFSINKWISDGRKRFFDPDLQI